MCGTMTLVARSLLTSVTRSQLDSRVSSNRLSQSLGAHVQCPVPLDLDRIVVAEIELVSEAPARGRDGDMATENGAKVGHNG